MWFKQSFLVLLTPSYNMQQGGMLTPSYNMQQGGMLTPVTTCSKAACLTALSASQNYNLTRFK
jgi:hypothetical protein